MKVSVIGVTGYGGLELLRLLRQHPKITIQSIHSQSFNNQDLSNHYPHLKNIVDLPIETPNFKNIIKHSDLIFFATPSGVSKDLAIPFIEEKFPIIDLSGDFRLNKDQEYERWYHMNAAPLHYIHQAEYGLTEFRETTTATFIANPGCYATVTLLALAPLIQQNLVVPNSIIVDAKSGFSGAGKSLSNSSHYPNAHDNMTLYKMNQHQHIPEIMQQIQKWDANIPAIQFSTSLIPVTRGIFITLYATPKRHINEKILWEIFQETYKNCPFIRIQPLGTFPNLKQVIGSNYCDIGVSYNSKTNTIVLVATIDNLIKGAAGQAIQNLNILCDFPETMGLEQSPLFP